MQTVIMDTSSQNLDVIANSLDLQPIEDNKKAAQDNIVADANKDLLELAKKRKDLEKVDNGGPQTVNNNLYLGSTADLLKLLKDNK
jgi:hypothetical protein